MSKLYLVGIDPGNPELTLYAEHVLEKIQTSLFIL